MNGALVIAVLVCLASSCKAQGTQSVSIEEFRGVRFGMTPAEASAAYGAPLIPLAPLNEDEDACHYLFPDGQIGPLSFMVSSGRVARVDVRSAETLTAEGVGVGSTEAEVRRAYGELVKASPHKYTGPEGQYLTVHPGGDLGIVFETDGFRVERFRIGRFPEVGWVEGCL